MALFFFLKKGATIFSLVPNFIGMNADFDKKMKEYLTAEKARLERELSSFAHRNPKAQEAEYETNFPNMGDKDDENASEVAEFSNNLSLEDELEKALRDVDSALERIDKGVYGVCKYCEQMINEKRIVARPTSSSCIQCKKTLTQEV